MSESVSPPVNTLNAPFWDGAKAGQLVLPQCAATWRVFWPPSPTSPYLTGGAVTWRAVSPVGVLRACVAYERVFQASFRPLAPYRIGLVELEVGPRLQAHLDGAAGPPAVGERVRLGFRQLVEGAHPVLVIVGTTSSG